MDIKIKQQNFTIPAVNVQSALDELIQAYPNKVELNYETSVSNLQYFLWVLGWHSRIWLDSSIFTINRLYNDSPKIENEDPILTLTCLSKHMSDDSYIVIVIDGKEVKFEKSNTYVDEVIVKEIDEIKKEYDTTPSTQQEVIEKCEIINITNVSLEETSIEEVINKTTKKRGRSKKST